MWVKSKHSQSNILQKVLKIDNFGRIYVEDLKSDQIFCSRHVVPTISLYTDRNPLNIHHQLGHNKFDALRNMAIIKIKLIVSIFLREAVNKTVFFRNNSKTGGPSPTHRHF